VVNDGERGGAAPSERCVWRRGGGGGVASAENREPFNRP
jgi:hypothetical protein